VTTATREPMSRPVWLILLSWGAAVLLITGLLSAWIFTNQRNAADERDRIRREQDKALCALISVFLTDPEPVAGPAGDYSRTVRAGMAAYTGVLRCSEFAGEPPAASRD